MRATVAKRLALGFGIGIAGLVVLAVVAFSGTSRLLGLAVETSERLSRTWSAVETISNAETEHLQWSKQIIKILLTAEPAAGVGALELDPRECGFGRWYYSEQRTALVRDFPTLADWMERLRTPHEQLHASCRQIDTLLQAGERAAATDYYLENTSPLLEEILTLFNAIQEELKRQAPSTEPLVRGTRQQQLAIGILGLAFILGIGLSAWWLTRNIVRSLREAIGTISSSSTEIAATTEQQEHSFQLQSAAVNQTAATVEELSRSSDQVAEQASAAALGAERVQTLGREGRETLQEMRGGISEMRSSVGAVSEQVLSLSELVGQIGEVTRLVSDLVGQTNLLSLNASVEAARAGEHGAGFAVVAQEIRKLAEESRKSAARIGGLVADVQKATSSLVMVAEEGGKSIESGARLGEQTGGKLEGISDSVEEIVQGVQQIALNARQQAEAVRQVRTAMDTVNRGMREGSTGLRQVRVGIDRLNDVANRIRDMV